jgi:uncharacterized protein YjiK
MSTARRLLCLYITLALIACSTSRTNSQLITSYDLANPITSFVLPDILHEVSGITALDATTLACVQDENGIVFYYDALKRTIARQLTFGGDGDYEGIARAGSNLYVLRSDGVLFEIKEFASVDPLVTEIPTGVPSDNNEGLCYDRNNHRLLIACKEKAGKGPEFKNHRAIYGFDLGTKTLTAEPVFNFDLRAIKQAAPDHHIVLPEKKKKSDDKTEPVLKFKPSAICLHPVTGKLYLISDADHLLFVFDTKGKLEEMARLDPAVFNKAEGLTFFPCGDMLISNEGQEKKPTLIRFGYKKK